MRSQNRYPRHAMIPSGLAALLLVGCGPAAQPKPEAPASSAPEQAPEVGPALVSWDSARDDAIKLMLDHEPRWGRNVGMHEHDGRIADYSVEAIEGYAKLLTGAQTTLTLSAPKGEDELLDQALLGNRIGLLLFDLEEMSKHRTDPRFYQELFDISGYIDFEYAPLEQRAQKLVAHEEAALKQVHHVLGNLQPSLSKPVVEVSIKVYRGYAEYLRDDVQKLLSGVGDAAFQARLNAANQALAAEAEKIAQRLEAEWLPKANETSHVLGEAKYREFVRRQEGRDIDLAVFTKMAEADLKRNKDAFLKLKSEGVKPTRPKASALLSEATKLMDESRAFVLDKDLITIPSEDRATLKETPPFMRWNAAFLNMPGPFDTAKQAFYYITLPDPSWPKKEQEEYVFPWGVLQATTVHEVYPGHFLHGLWIRQAPTKVQKMVDSYSFTEGWAHYTEQMMIEQGFRTDNKENVMGQLMDALLRNCRFTASIGIHTQGWSLERAAKHFEEDCMQDKASAREQAVRGTFDPGYFAYTLGKVQILELRAELQKELGDKFQLKAFHDALMSHGAPPVALIADRVRREVRGQ